MNPNNVKWTSETKEALYYSFGDSGDESNINNVFVINMFITENVVSRIEFFAPSTKEEANAQQTKLFFLLIITLSDDTLDKDGREYVSYYDTWDLDPFDNNTLNKISKSVQSSVGINAPEIYGRVYLDELPSYKSTFKQTKKTKKRKGGIRKCKYGCW